MVKPAASQLSSQVKGHIGAFFYFCDTVKRAPVKVEMLPNEAYTPEMMQILNISYIQEGKSSLIPLLDVLLLFHVHHAAGEELHVS